MSSQDLPGPIGVWGRLVLCVNIVLASVIAWQGLGGGLIMLSAGFDDPQLGTRTGWTLVGFYVVVLALYAFASAAVLRGWRGHKLLESVALVVGAALLSAYAFGGR